MVRIITDGTSDMSLRRGAELNVDVIPMRVFFGEESFRDGVDITREEFFARLASSRELPTTSQLNPDDFLELFQKYADQGDQIVGIFVSAELSGTCQSACIARDMVEGGEIHIVDSRTATFALALLVEEAARLRDRGLSAADVAAGVEELARRTRLLAIVDTLTYLKRGGRISAATAAVGGLLGIKPIVGVDGRGTVEALGKARSIHAGLEWIARRIGGPRLPGGLRPLQLPRAGARVHGGAEGRAAPGPAPGDGFHRRGDRHPCGPRRGWCGVHRGGVRSAPWKTTAIKKS